MNQKLMHWLQGAVVGAIGWWAALAFGLGWNSSSTTTSLADAEVAKALLPYCVASVLADPTASAELKTKAARDYDDVVRDYRKRSETLSTMGYQFNRDCGKAIELKLATPTKT